jgi:hypothetical protein
MHDINVDSDEEGGYHGLAMLTRNIVGWSTACFAQSGSKGVVGMIVTRMGMGMRMN